MKPIEALSKKDKDIFISYIKQNAANYCASDYSSVTWNDMSSMADADTLLRFWNDNKEFLFHLLGDKLQLRVPYEADYNAATINYYNSQGFSNNEDDRLYPFFFSLINFLKLKYNCRGKEISKLLKSILENNSWTKNKINLEENIVVTSLADKEILNWWEQDVVKYYPNAPISQPNKKITIQPSTKLTTALKQIIKFTGLGDETVYVRTATTSSNYTLNECYEKACTEISILTQNKIKKIEGTFMFSIHPMDYLTMSDNNYGWHSCMSWTTDGGCYKMGTVEMMNSSMVMEVAYFPKKEQDIYVGWNAETQESYSWNSKKWRTQLIIMPGFITTIKSYPYACPQFEAYVVKKAAELMNNYFDIDMFDAENEIYTYNSTDSLFKITKPNYLKFGTECMYNDMFLTTHTCVYNREIFDRHFEKESTKRDLQYYVNAYDDAKTINYSGEAECMCCGQTLGLGDLYDECEGYVLCQNCSEVVEEYFAYCEICGDPIIESIDSYAPIHNTNEYVHCDCGYQCDTFIYDEWNNEFCYPEDAAHITIVDDNGEVHEDEFLLRDNCLSNSYLNAYFGRYDKELLKEKFGHYLDYYKDSREIAEIEIREEELI